MTEQTWDLDVFFQGGSKSGEFAAHLEKLERDVRAFRGRLGQAPDPESGREPLASFFYSAVSDIQSLQERQREAGAFVSCLTAQDVKDQTAKGLAGIIQQRAAEQSAAFAEFDRFAGRIPDGLWRELLSDPAVADIAAPLDERRRRAKDKLPLEQELLITDLSIDGYHGWGQLYNTVVGRMSIESDGDGGRQRMSIGQAANAMMTPDREKRARLFEKWRQAWASEEDLCADALNRIGGFRLQVYAHRGWESVLREPLEINRMSRETLDAMWSAVEDAKPLLVEALIRKANRFGAQKPAWHDVSAPIGETAGAVSYEEAQDFIVRQFSTFSEDMAAFARRAFAERWIEAEDRPGKRPGGFCTSFPVSGQSRIFMTFSGSPQNVATLAHELGHAYHQHAMGGMAQLAKNYAMNVAETASTFAEMIVSDAALRAAGPGERLALLDDKVQRAAAFFMNIHARFLFELDFYDARRAGPVSPEDLGRMMADAQKRAYRDALSEYEPHFWASKLHFYITNTPFYNFPYTFGYLFSTGVYGRALEEGKGFSGRYVELLRDTGRMRVEELALKHLGVDLTRTDFWKSAAELALQDVREFLRVTGTAG